MTLLLYTKLLSNPVQVEVVCDACGVGINCASVHEVNLEGSVASYM